MGALGSKLGYSDTAADGTKRSIGSQLLDPVGVCLQPAKIDPFAAPDVDAIEVPAAAEPVVDAAVDAAPAPAQ